MDEALGLNPNNPYFLNNMGITQHKMAILKMLKIILKEVKNCSKLYQHFNNIGN